MLSKPASPHSCLTISCQVHSWCTSRVIPGWCFQQYAAYILGWCFSAVSCILHLTSLLTSWSMSIVVPLPRNLYFLPQSLGVWLSWLKVKMPMWLSHGDNSYTVVMDYVLIWDFEQVFAMTNTTQAPNCKAMSDLEACTTLTTATWLVPLHKVSYTIRQQSIDSKLGLVAVRNASAILDSSSCHFLSTTEAKLFMW